jgi:hypothetical protein
MIYRVHLPNDYFPVGEFVEDGDDGMVQALECQWIEGKLQIHGYKGLLFPIASVRPFLFAILKRGFDDVGAFRTQRRAN